MFAGCDSTWSLTSAATLATVFGLSVCTLLPVIGGGCTWFRDPDTDPTNASTPAIPANRPTPRMIHVVFPNDPRGDWASSISAMMSLLFLFPLEPYLPARNARG